MLDMGGKCPVLVVLALAAVSSTGCGTICNFASGHPEPYGGLAKDAEALSSSSSSSPHFGGGIGDPRALLILLGLGAAELGATTTADTLTLPYFWWRDGWLSKERPVINKEYFNLPIQYSVGAAIDPATLYRQDRPLSREYLDLPAQCSVGVSRDPAVPPWASTSGVDEALEGLGAPPPCPPPD
jgi:hypothetical protein